MYGIKKARSDKYRNTKSWFQEIHRAQASIFQSAGPCHVWLCRKISSICNCGKYTKHKKEIHTNKNEKYPQSQKGRERRKREMGGGSLFVDHSPLDWSSCFGKRGHSHRVSLPKQDISSDWEKFLKMRNGGSSKSLCVLVWIRL